MGEYWARSGAHRRLSRRSLVRDHFISSAPRWHWTGIDDPGLDEMLERRTRGLDPEVRREIVREMQLHRLRRYPPDPPQPWVEHRWSRRDYVRDIGVWYGSFSVGRKWTHLWLDR